MSPMVTSIRKGAKPHVYLREWRKAKTIKAEAMAERLGIERESYYRLERDPKKLSVAEVVELADALGIEPSRMWHPPEGPPSVDDMLNGISADQRALVVDLARRVIGKAN